jgi:hypothetical protein
MPDELFNIGYKSGDRTIHIVLSGFNDHNLFGLVSMCGETADWRTINWSMDHVRPEWCCAECFAAMARYAQRSAA